MSALQKAIETCITEITGTAFVVADRNGIGGGCINETYRLRGNDGRSFFIKQNAQRLLPAFEAEGHALDAMLKTKTIRVPAPVGTCHADGQAALVLEYLAMGNGRSGNWETMGRQLARMHRHIAENHGWPHDNWIGSSPQINTPGPDGIRFLAECRLGPQVEWARKRGLALRDAEALMERLPDLHGNYVPQPSLLHGDLWAGNAGFLDDGTPVIFDPAAYYGDREADIAMTEMFGGYSPAFYEGYNAEWPLDPGYRIRKQLHLLYHTLNHYNLFGGGYGSQAESLIASLLRS
ncbi:MAG: fructosamine kinase family protein [Puniceicoccaceae bacterium]